MRVLNLNDLAGVRGTQLAGQTCIGRGSFAAVYEKTPDSDSVTKLTVDAFNYSLLADSVWLRMREDVDSHFPRVIEDHGDVGESRGLTAYMVELERLYPVTSKEQRAFIRKLIAEYDAFRPEEYGYSNRQPACQKWHSKSFAFCEAKASEDGELSQVFAALTEFIGCYGGALDLKFSNFMCRANGDLVWNDVVFDVKTFNKFF